MIVVWALALVLGVVVAALGSRRAVDGALALAEDLGISTGFVGVTVVAIGTDLPEIANSISASLTGHGDLNVGDSTGSALTQITLVLAILLLVSRELANADSADRDSIAVLVGAATVAATLVIMLVIWDRRFSRLDGAILVGLWGVSLIALKHRYPSTSSSSATPNGAVKKHLTASIAWLGVVGIAATVIVQAFVRLAADVGVPELVASTVVLALGTSLPELVVDLTAIRRGAAALAVGDLFGSSLVDSTLSIGIGPLIRPTSVSAEAVPSVAVVAVGIALATLLWHTRVGSRRVIALQFALVYAGCMASLIIVAAS